MPVWRQWSPRPPGYFKVSEILEGVPERKADAPKRGSVHAVSLLPPREPLPEPRPPMDEANKKRLVRELWGRNEYKKTRYDRETREAIGKVAPKTHPWVLSELERADPIGQLRANAAYQGRVDIRALRRYLKCPTKEIKRLMGKLGIPIQLEYRGGKYRDRTISLEEAEKVLEMFYFKKGERALKELEAQPNPDIPSSTLE